MVAVLALTACGADTDGATDNPEGGTASAAPAEISLRLDSLDHAIADWADASSIGEAHAAAEAARNLVVGPDGPFYGDANSDGTIAGGNEIGLLPGLDGVAGLAGPPAANSCVDAHVLGGSWDDAAARWDIALTAIDQWAPGNNTFPSLPSHPQRIVGWATLTLSTESLDEAHEYAGHAALHASVTRQAYESCADG